MTVFSKILVVGHSIITIFGRIHIFHMFILNTRKENSN